MNEKLVRKYKILVSLDNINSLMDATGKSRVCVYNALAYRTNSKLAQRIRMLALDKFGGKRVIVPALVEC